MYEKLKNVFRSQEQGYPSPQTQANIGGLAVHYVDEVYTRLERLTDSGRIKEAKADTETLLAYFQKLGNREKLQEPFETLRCSQSCKLAIEYLDKLFTLLDSLLEAGRIEEAQALKVYLDQINKRRERYGNSLEGIVKRKGRKRM
jgi:hypothetical protein